MKRIYVKDKNGKDKVLLHSIEYSGEYMGECFVQTNVASPSPIPWAIGDYIEYRGEVFTLNYIPACKVQNDVNRFSYENVKFDSPIDELVRCSFKDIVPDDNEIHWTGMSTFSFYCENVRDLARRIQANLDFVYGKGVWDVSVDESFTKTKPQSISVQDQNVWQGLSMCYDNFKANFIVRGRKIVIGTKGKPLGKVFKYGIGKGLTALERTSDSSQLICTRLRAYGNTTNLPTNYYKYLSMKVRAKIVTYFNTATDLYKNRVSILFDTEVLQDPLVYYNQLEESDERNSYNKFLSTNQFPIKFGDSLTAYVYPFWADEPLGDGGKCVYCEVNSDLVKKWLESNPNGEVVISGNEAINMNKVILRHPADVDSEAWPNNMAVTRLMLPSFPSNPSYRDLGDGYKLVFSKSDVYIDSPNIGSLGIRESAVYIDGTDNDSTDEDVYPSLYKMTAKDVQAAGLKCDIPSGDNGKLDQFADATIIDDDGDNVDGTLKGSIAYVWTKDLGFNPKSMLMAGVTAQVFIKTGMCAGQTFDISSITEDTSTNKRYRLALNRKADELGFYLPNRDFPIKAGDEFVLLGIRMPDVYVKAASERLLNEALIYLKDNDRTKFTYAPTLDALFMEREKRAKGAESLYMNMKEGDVFEFEEQESMGIVGALFISNLGIKESSEEPLPEYTITLEEKKSVSTLTKMANSISASISSGSGGITPSIVDSIIDSRADEFLKRKEDDTALGKITFDKGLISASSVWMDDVADGIVEFKKE